MVISTRHTARDSFASPSLNGAAMVDDKGRETPITEEMIRDALDALVADWEKGHQRSAAD
ncbi:MAG: PA1571 family protein [Pseudomonadota bacterium]